MSGITCQDCKHRCDSHCRRYPPGLWRGNFGLNAPDACFPSIKPDWWCGQGELKAETAQEPSALPTPPTLLVGYVAEIAALRAQVVQMEQERADLLRRSDAARHAHEDLKTALNRTIQDCRDQNAVQCQEIVTRNLQLERLQEKWDKKEKECQGWAKQNSEMGADITRCHKRYAELLREREAQDKTIENLKREADKTYAKLTATCKEYADLAAMHRADCDRWAKAHPGFPFWGTSHEARA